MELIRNKERPAHLTFLLKHQCAPAFTQERAESVTLKQSLPMTRFRRLLQAVFGCAANSSANQAQGTGRGCRCLHLLMHSHSRVRECSALTQMCSRMLCTSVLSRYSIDSHILRGTGRRRVFWVMCGVSGRTAEALAVSKRTGELAIMESVRRELEALMRLDHPFVTR